MFNNLAYHSLIPLGWVGVGVVGGCGCGGWVGEALPPNCPNSLSKVKSKQIEATKVKGWGHDFLCYVSVTQILAIYLMPKKELWHLSRSFHPILASYKIWPFIVAFFYRYFFHGLIILLDASRW